jgi:hypothetical protein
MSEQELTTSDIAHGNDPVDEPTTREREGGEQTVEGAAPDTQRDAARTERSQDAAGSDTTTEPLLPSDAAGKYQGRWQGIQTGFVDEPRNAVREADALVAELMQELAAGFSQARETLEAQWDSGDDVSTEDLRVALTRYRSFFERLLSA